MDRFRSRDAAGLQLQVIDVVHDRVHELGLTEQMKTDIKDESRRDLKTNALRQKSRCCSRRKDAREERKSEARRAPEKKKRELQVWRWG